MYDITGFTQKWHSIPIATKCNVLEVDTARWLHKKTGVDEGLNQFIHGQTPMHTDPPPMVDISMYPDTAETKGASSTALFNKYSTTITKTGERLDSITVNQPNLWLTEMKQDQDGNFLLFLFVRINVSHH